MVRPSPKLRHGDGEPESSLAPSKKRNRGGGASRAAVEPHDLKRSARKIYDYLVRILSSDTKQHTEEINDLPEDFDGIKWYRVFDVDEAYSASKYHSFPRGFLSIISDFCCLPNRCSRASLSLQVRL